MRTAWLRSGWRNLVDPHRNSVMLVQPFPDMLKTEGQFFELEQLGPHEWRQIVASFESWLGSLE